MSSLPRYSRCLIGFQQTLLLTVRGGAVSGVGGAMDPPKFPKSFSFTRSAGEYNMLISSMNLLSNRFKVASHDCFQSFCFIFDGKDSITQHYFHALLCLQVFFRASKLGMRLTTILAPRSCRS
ncbi:uncharacterized protein LOC113285979 [Papaver somniferum]|uniref:uncharacterized protein LOC113285979 n=1 Tax=Papaver somniferum TaxID=3469 RepID=UPI000E703969|nr:uncharacterized protein LOC113285979 [Papaver somniferum]